MRLFRRALILAPLLALLVVGVWYGFREFRGRQNGDTVSGPDGGGRLVVLVVFDQLRGDYPERWAALYGSDGFERIKKDGVWFPEAHLPYACTSTGPGHASIATGAPPSVHGIVENSWYDRSQGKLVYCASGDRPYPRVPANSDAGVRAKTADGGLAPDRLLATTVSTELVKQTSGRGRVFSLALKDRAAVLMGGQQPSGVYCFDTATGEFHTSGFYRDKAHSWVEKFNTTHAADRWFNSPWNRLVAENLYTASVGPDDGPGEGSGSSHLGKVFPHLLHRGLPGPGAKYYAALEYTPFANEMLWDLAKAAIEAENLGHGDAPDLLCLGFSANDLVGHTYGPDSHEVMDITLRSDKLLADMIAHLSEKVGAGRFAVIVTADHGVSPLPERAFQSHPDAGRFDPVAEFGPLAEALDVTFGRRTVRPGQWVEKMEYPWVYLNRKLAQAEDVPVADLEAFAAQWLGNRAVCASAIPHSVLAGLPASDPLVRSAQLAYHPTRCGDVLIVNKPYTIPGGDPKAVPPPTGTTHGSPHPYDTHVPVLAFGCGLPAIGPQPGRVSALLVAPLVCRALGITPPGTAAEPLPPAFAPK